MDATTEEHVVPEKPYRVICISMYTDDLAALDAMVESLKDRGVLRANRSQLIRIAVKGLKLDELADEISADLAKPRLRGDR